MRLDRIEIVEYDENWPRLFEQQRDRLDPVLRPWLLRPIEHVGSTSVPGLPAKAIIDMLAVVNDFGPVEQVFEELAGLGWQHAPEPGDRESRKWSLCYPSVERRTHHLHVVEETWGWQGLLAFRDHLRTSPADRDEYARIKQELAAADNEDRPRYRSGKAPFITAVLADLRDGVAGGEGRAGTVRGVTELRVPGPLAAGDRVAVVAPSGPVVAERLDVGTTYLKEWGLEVEVMPSVLAGNERLTYLAAEDKARAEDLRNAWLDERFAAVFCARGGYGVQRMLEYVDFDELVAVPKWFVGFSDITALHEPLNARGLVTIHGPMAATVEQLAADAGRNRLRELLFQPANVTDLLAPTGARTVVPGVAEGPLRGGNLALLAAGIGTPTYAPPAGIVVLEDINEDCYRVDRLLTQLLRAGWFDQVAGVVVGDFSEADEENDDVVHDRLEPLGLPMVEGASIGHEELNLAVPLGLPVRLDATAATLTPLFG